MHVTALWWEAWMWIAATRSQGSVSVGRLIKGSAVTPAGRAFTWITLPGSVCHVTVARMEPSARTAAGKQQRVEVMLFYHEKEKALALKDQSGLNKGGRGHKFIKYFIYFYCLTLYIIFNIKIKKPLIYWSSSSKAPGSPILLCDNFSKFHGKNYWESNLLSESDNFLAFPVETFLLCLFTCHWIFGKLITLCFIFSLIQMLEVFLCTSKA